MAIMAIITVVLLWFMISWICSPDTRKGTDGPKGPECKTPCQYSKRIVHGSTDLIHLKKTLDSEFNLHYSFGELVLKYLDELARIVQEMESVNSRARKEDKSCDRFFSA